MRVATEVTTLLSELTRVWPSGLVTVNVQVAVFLFFSVHSEFLDIWDVNMIKRPDEINRKQHHTVLYNSDNLIVRRGQEFQIKITFNRPYKPAEDKFALEFAIGEPSIM